MKQCIKLGIIIILAALLHNGAMKAADFLCTPAAGNKTQCCILSQAPTAQQAVRHLYNHILATTLCMEYVDNAQVPANKSIQLFANLFRIQLHAYSPECDRLLFLSPHPVPDANYYIFGLRKIII